MSASDPKNMSERDLLANLLTADYRGATFKALCLDELISRKQDEIRKKYQEGA